jgi:acetyl esterase/lipase
MLDDRNDSLSVKQFWDEGTYTGAMNLDSWNYTISNRGQDGVSIYVAPSRATDLSGLPRTFIEIGSAEPFRDEDVAYAMKLWEYGNDCELHVWPGGLHGYDVFGKESRVSKAAIAARWNWLRRLFGSSE